MDKPVLLTVDDDPAVSRAVARDLRRQYGDRHRIVRAESGAQALEALAELHERGEQVAVLIADQRMPQMDGVAFLEQAAHRYPRAKRVLLTAYADTGAAIRAINDVDIDHYLLKPWDPPEERLYPVLDSLITAWETAPVPDESWATVIGARFSAPSFELRDFLANNGVPYRWYDVGQAEARRLLRETGTTEADVPVVIAPDSTVLRGPSKGELAEYVGLSVTASDDLYDVVIVGGGPAGLGAAVYAASEGLRTLLVERQATGGQAGQSSRIENYLGFPDGISGSQFIGRARRQALKFGAEIVSTRDVTGLHVDGDVRTISCDGDVVARGHAVVLATGVSYRTLDAPGLAELTDRGVYYGAALTTGPDTRDQDVYIVGAANSAGQAAVFFSRYARRVIILVRGAGLEASMSHYLIEQLEQIPNVEVRVRTEVSRAHGTGRLRELTLRDRDSGTEETVPASWLFVFIGASPRTGWLDGSGVRRDRDGYILTGGELLDDCDGELDGWSRPPFVQETAVPGVFAAGDSRAASVKRVASAVGEGAMTVMLVHRYLDTLDTRKPGEDPGGPGAAATPADTRTPATEGSR
ncbi:FAD-dependent oxidoreductase [Embleya sp. MST-111070]|uniref:FAD-dependent oxidoreductase n=1 Tax=Embleya sp. MST-111070 TaxID=3398231 RepID=UPI003F73EB02